MYVCLCKALTEAEVAQRSRACIAQGITDLDDIIEVLDLRGDEVCGFCADNPQDILGIFEDELELHRGYTPSPNEVPAEA